MIAVTYGIRQFYLQFKIRVRQWGQLPAERGATVLITNHQHMDEGETITARTFFLHPGSRSSCAIHVARLKRDSSRSGFPGAPDSRAA